MTDTHDTNLPEKPVELEEEKKTAEVSEPATTETPAEEIVSKKPVESVLKLTKEEILAKLKEVVADVENVAKPEIDGLKQSFYKLHNAEQDAARKLFIENGGAAENFVPQTDCVEEEFKNIMSVIKEKRSALTAELEKQKEMNLCVFRFFEYLLCNAVEQSAVFYHQGYDTILCCLPILDVMGWNHIQIIDLWCFFFLVFMTVRL